MWNGFIYYVLVVARALPTFYIIAYDGRTQPSTEHGETVDKKTEKKRMTRPADGDVPLLFYFFFLVHFPVGLDIFIQRIIVYVYIYIQL